MWLIAGLGNPGSEYELTRHNIGFSVCRQWVKHHKAEWTQGKGNWLHCQFSIRRHQVLAALPQTFMNLSGEAIGEISRYYRILPEQIIVIVDEYNFPLGRVHVKKGGSDGGHNGLTSVIAHLKTQNFWRLRCGIDKNFGAGELVSYVLSNFGADELPTVAEMITKACTALDAMIAINSQRAMSEINSGKIFEP